MGGDGTIEGVNRTNSISATGSGGFSHPTDEVYVLNPFESVSISATQTWQDNRHRAYFSSGTGNVNGFLLFDCSNIPDNSLIISMVMRCYLENAFGSPYSNPIVDVYWSDDDNWTRNTVTPNQLSLNDLLVDNVPFSSYVTYYDFQINVSAHNWLIDLLDNQMCFGFKDDVTYYSYVYFFGAYGSPTGPAPVLTITTTTGTPQNVIISLTPINPPIQIPAIGGTFSYTVNITNNDTATANFNGWIMVTLPDSTLYGPVLTRTLSLAPGASLTRTLSQYVPAAAPAGTYTYTANIGIYPSNIWDSDQFNFTKLADYDKAYTGNEKWTVVGWEEENSVAKVPETPILLSAYPNPFNSSCKITFDLKTAGMTKLAIYNVQGEELEVLSEGWLNAGRQEFEFNANQSPTGIYFVRLATPYEARTQKLVYIK
jgi:hypothetical protein